jgi:membrane protein
MTPNHLTILQRAQDGAEEAAQTVRRTRPFLDHLVRAGSRYQADAGRRLAAALTFYGFLSFFPLVALAFSITGFVVDAFPDLQQKLIDQINSYLPGLSLDVGAIGNAKVASGLIGIVGLLIGGLGWVNSLREAMRTIWHHNINAGNVIIKKMHDTVILAGLGLTLILSIAVTGAASAFANRIIEALDLSGSSAATYLLRAVSIMVAIAADTLVYGFLFTRLPKVAMPLRRVLLGAFFAAIGLEVLKIVGVYLVPRKTNNPLYLTFGVLFGLLIWINMVSRWTLLAAAWTVTKPYDTDVAPSGTASVEMARLAGIPEHYAGGDPNAVPATVAGGAPSPLQAAIQGRTPPQYEPEGRGGERAATTEHRRGVRQGDPVRSITPRTATVHREHQTLFHLAHGVLIVANLVLACALARIGLRIRRRSAAADREIFRQGVAAGRNQRSAGPAGDRSGRRSGKARRRPEAVRSAGTSAPASPRRSPS